MNKTTHTVPNASREAAPRDTVPDPPRAHGKAFYAEARRRAARTDDAHAFVSDPAEHKAPLDDDLAETLGEDFLTAATSGEEAGAEVFDAVVPEEQGGPFITVSSAREFASGTDPSNPAEAEPAEFPTANASPTGKRASR